MDESFEIGRRAGAEVIISHHKCSGRQNFGRMRETLPKIDEAMKHQQIAFDVYPYVAGSTVLRKEMLPRADKVLITWSDKIPEASGRDLKDIAGEMERVAGRGVRSPQSRRCDLFHDGREGRAGCMSHPSAMIGSDGSRSTPIRIPASGAPSRVSSDAMRAS